MELPITEGESLYLALLKAGKICRYPNCELQAGHEVKWRTVEDFKGNEREVSEINQTRFCWYHGRKAQN